jgi:hypothetical protein
VNLTRKRKTKRQINKIKDEKGAIRKTPMKFGGALGNKMIENLYSNKLDWVEEINKILDVQDQPKLNQVNINQLNI